MHNKTNAVVAKPARLICNFRHEIKMKLCELNFLDYLGKEEQNLLASVVNFKDEFDLFYNLDLIYQEPIQRLAVSANNIVISQLYLLVHFYLYFSISCLLRSHLSETLSSIRKAIDASLSAYKIILDSNLSMSYLNRDKYFQFIKANIQKEMKNDAKLYPLAHDLIKIHDACSEYGSHSDISSFFHRLETKETDNKDQGMILLHYFQFPRNPEEYKFYFITTLQGFYAMFLIFKLFFDKNLKIIDPNWEYTINYLGPHLNKLRQESFSKFNNKYP